ncbi:MAG: ABC transporter ATP-binding protein [Chloroflexi bacterium]|nr:ABC transporter ATP-binding protein [Chloroflexota bacterium]
MKVLSVNSICKNFGGLQALCNVNLNVELGERRVIIGPNGAGKTTLFHIISGILPPTSGAIHLAEEDITHLPMHHRVGLGVSQTFQIINLFKGLTVLENVILALRSFTCLKYNFYRHLKSCRDAFDEADNLLKEWSLWDKRDTKVANLSYGDQRLLDIMLALISHPKLLLLDEPTSGLPAAEAQTVIARIKELSREITTLIIEHNMDVALSLADFVTVLHLGQVVAEGTPEEMRRHAEVKRIYLGADGGAVS